MKNLFVTPPIVKKRKMKSKGIEEYISHDQLNKFFKIFQESKRMDFVKAEGYFKRFRCDLLRHMMWEEEILFTFIEGKIDRRKSWQTSILCQEHHQIRRILNSMKKKIDEKSSETEKEEKELISILKEHNDKEESVIYPIINKLMTNKEQKELLSKTKSFIKQRCKACFRG